MNLWERFKNWFNSDEYSEGLENHERRIEQLELELERLKKSFITLLETQNNMIDLLEKITDGNKKV